MLSTKELYAIYIIFVTSHLLIKRLCASHKFAN